MESLKLQITHHVSFRFKSEFSNLTAQMSQTHAHTEHGFYNLSSHIRYVPIDIVRVSVCDELMRCVNSSSDTCANAQLYKHTHTEGQTTIVLIRHFELRSNWNRIRNVQMSRQEYLQIYILSENYCCCFCPCHLTFDRINFFIERTQLLQMHIILIYLFISFFH